MSNQLFGIAKQRLVDAGMPRIYISRRVLAELNDFEESRARKKSFVRREREFRACGMSARLFDTGRNAFNTKAISWTGDTQKALLLDMSATGTYVKVISTVSNASPAVYTTTVAHGFSTGDVVVVTGVLGNLSTNQTGLVTSPSGSTFSMTTLEGQTIAGSAAYTSGGYCIDLTQAQFVSGILGNRVGTDQTLAGTTSSKGVANATTPITWPTVPSGNPAQAVVFYDAAGGSDATNQIIGWQDGKIRVITVGDTPLSSTSMKVQPLRAQLWDGSTGSAPVLWFSNGFSATLNAAAAQGADSLTVTSTGHDIPDLQTADVIAFGAGLPVTPSGGNIAFNIGSIYAPLTPTGIYEL
jgi:hypothetical protein